MNASSTERFHANVRTNGTNAIKQRKTHASGRVCKHVAKNWLMYDVVRSVLVSFACMIMNFERHAFSTATATSPL
jgi:hypothetical protein